MLIIIVLGDTEINGEEDIWEGIKIIKIVSWDKREGWWNCTPKDKSGVINKEIRYTRERSDKEYNYITWFEYLIWYLELEILKDEMQTYKQMVITARQGNIIINGYTLYMYMYNVDIYFICLCLELQESQTLLMIEKKTSLVKSQELEFSRKQITGLKGKHKHTTTVSSGL